MLPPKLKLILRRRSFQKLGSNATPCSKTRTTAAPNASGCPGVAALTGCFRSLREPDPTPHQVKIERAPHVFGKAVQTSLALFCYKSVIG